LIFSNEIIGIIAVFVAFGIIVTASNHLAKIFQKIHLPLITGFIIIGVLAGPYLLKMLPGDLTHLEFINDISLAFIAIASGAEIFLKEMRDKVKDIRIMASAQLFIVFIVSFAVVYLFADFVPFMKNAGQSVKIAAALLISTIFTASSPASAIAVINELRAKGSFTKIALGVTIIKDIFVILLFAVTFAVADVLISGNDFRTAEIFIVAAGLFLSILAGVAYGKLIEINFKINKNEYLDIAVVLLLGWSMFLFSSFVSSYSKQFFSSPLHLEPLLIGIIASFYITNYSEYRVHLEKLTHRFGHYIYAAFFTLIGATLSIDVLIKFWPVAVFLFAVRITALITASVIGSVTLKESRKEILMSWMPYVTQAGVSLGLITIISAEFLGLGVEFEAILIAVIIINQFVGPPLLKWAIVNVKEAHTKSKDYKFDFHKDVFILGLGGKAVLLAKTLYNEGYSVQIITDRKNINDTFCKDVKINIVEKITRETLEKYNFKSADSAVIMRKPDVAYEICEIIYENFGTPNVIVVVETPTETQRFKKLGAIVVAPTGALIALLEHFVRSPHATSILLGMQKNHETEEIEVLADDVHGVALRDLHLPVGVLIMSVSRNGETMLTGGYTRLRKHDIVTVVGSQEQIDLVRTKLQF